jgi:predicted RNA binding protein YcfA (HicA-like mRNA interferase family)
MAPLPVLSATETVRAFERLGWRVARSANHIIMTRAGYPAVLSIPNHKEISTGTLRKLIRTAGVTVDEFVAIVKGGA